MAVFEGRDGVSDGDLTLLAKEFNFSEVTSVASPNSDGSVPVRIFTPASEIRFAGHPLLGTAAALSSQNRETRSSLVCGIGAIEITLNWQSERTAEAWMTQRVPVVEAFPASDGLLEVLGVSSSILPVDLYDNGMAHVFVALKDEAAVAELRPNLQGLATFTASFGLHAGINCFARTDHGWKTRMFAPGDGVDEDPATGSAAGPLAVHLARHGLLHWGEETEIQQGAEVGRPSLLRAKVVGSVDGVEDVLVGGRVDVLGKGEMSW